ALLLVRQKRDVFSLPSGTRAWARFLQSRLASGAPLSRPAREPHPGPDPALYSTPPAPRNRVPLMDLYLGKRYLTVFGFVLLSAAALYQTVEMKGLVDAHMENPLPLSLAIKYLAYFTPGMLKLVMPVAAVAGAMITLGALCRNN